MFLKASHFGRGAEFTRRRGHFDTHLKPSQTPYVASSPKGRALKSKLFDFVILNATEPVGRRFASGSERCFDGLSLCADLHFLGDIEHAIHFLMKCQRIFAEIEIRAAGKDLRILKRFIAHRVQLFVSQRDRFILG